MNTARNRIQVLLSLVLGLALAPVLLPAQALHIYYNLFNDSIRYELDGKTVRKPRIKKGGMVYIHLTEFNPYLYTATVTVRNDPGQYLVGGTQYLSGEGGDDGMSMASPMMGIFGALNSPLFEMPLMSMGGQDFSLASFAGAARGGAEEQLITETEQLVREMSETEARLQKVSGEIRAISRSLLISTMIEHHLDQIQYNASLPPSSIKRLTTEYFEAMFGPGSLDSLTLEQSLDWTQQSANMRRKTSEWNRLTRRWNQQLEDLQYLLTSFDDLAIEDDELKNRLADIQEAAAISLDEKAALDSIGSNSSQLVKNLQSAQAESLANLYLRYKELMTNPFEYQDFFYMTGKSVALHVELVRRDTTPTDFSDEEPKDEVVKARSIVVESYGGLKLSAGAGVNFAQYFDQPQQYGVKDGLIVADADDRFVPAITSQLLFYGNRGERTSFGGSFGVGLPVLSGSDQVAGAMFFLGPSVIFGSNQRIVLTGGVLGGKTTRLSNGYEVGDPFDPTFGEIPTSTRYEYGYFLGLSFNFSSN